MIVSWVTTGGTMTENKLRESLEKLHFELMQLAPLDESMQEKVDGLAAYICELLDQPELEESHASLEEMLDDSVSSFETSHPKVTQLINEILGLLSGIGI
jgi:hypothetical protein